MRSLLGVMVSAALVLPASAAMLYDNGPFVTGIGDGAGGADTSTVEDGYSARGYIANNVAEGNGPYYIRDDFEVTHPDGWQLDNAELFAFQTNSSLVSTITDAYVTLFDTVGNVVWGDWNTSLPILANEWTGAYRVTTDPLATNRPIMRVAVDLSAAPLLPQGHYWLGFSMCGSLLSGPWAVPKTPHDTTDNAETWSGASGTWTQIGAPDLVQDFPLKLHGTPEPASLGLMLIAALGLMRRR